MQGYDRTVVRFVLIDDSMKRLVFIRHAGLAGIAIHTQSFSTAVAALLQDSRSVQFEVWDADSPSELKRKLVSAQLTDQDILVLFTGLNVFQVIGKLPCYTIVFTVWESTTLPDSWIGCAPLADEVWIPSRWGKDILVQNGNQEKKIFVVPEGVDTVLFSPEKRKIGFLETIDSFKFLNIAKAEPRKGTVDLLRAFDLAFDPDDEVHLILSCTNLLIPNFSSHKFVQNLGLKNRDKVILIQLDTDHQQVARLYCSCDAFVFPTHAEGWGLPVLEAMASGLPTAVTHFSAITEFANTTNSLGIRYQVGSLGRGDLMRFDRSDGDYGEWAIPDIEKLADTMRYMFENQAACRQMGKRACIDARKWTWRNAAEIALQRIHHIYDDLNNSV